MHRFHTEDRDLLESRHIPARPHKRERGVVSIIVVLGLVVLVGFVAMAVDTGYMMTTRTQLQNATDAAALSAAVSIRTGSTLSAAASDAVDTAALNDAGGGPVGIQTGDVVFGSWDFNSRTFSPGPFAGVSAVRVTANNDLSLLLSPVIGFNTANVAASSTAALGRRDLMMVQDVSGSFRQELPQARDALRDLTNAMSNQGLSGDRVGLSIFSAIASLEQGLTEIPAQLGQIINAIDTFSHCDALGDPVLCYTHIALGLDEAIDEIDANPRPHTQRVIVLVSDGVPCADSRAEIQSRRDAAQASAARADSLDINIYTIFLSDGVSTCPRWGSTVLEDEEYLKTLKTGFGQFFKTTNPNDLDNILVSIVAEMPMVLVE